MGKIITPNKRLLVPDGGAAKKRIQITRAEYERRVVEHIVGELEPKYQDVVSRYAAQILALADTAAVEKWPDEAGILLPKPPHIELFKLALSLVGTRLVCPELTELPKE